MVASLYRLDAEGRKALESRFAEIREKASVLQEKERQEQTLAATEAETLLVTL
jgi:DNA-binding PadR family transcriptional regulator